MKVMVNMLKLRASHTFSVSSRNLGINSLIHFTYFHFSKLKPKKIEEKSASTSLIEKGTLDLKAKKYDSALAHFKKCADLIKKSNMAEVSNISTVYNSLFIIYYAKGDYENALVYAKKQIEIGLESDNSHETTRFILGLAYCNAADAYQKLSDYDNFINNFNYSCDALSKFKQTKQKNVVYQKLIKISEEAKVYNLTIKVLHMMLNNSNEIGNSIEAINYNYKLAKLYMINENYQESLKYLVEALNIRIDSGHTETLEYLENLIHIGQLKQKTGDIESALTFFKEASIMAAKPNIKLDIRLHSQLCFSLAEIYQSTENTKKASEFYITGLKYYKKVTPTDNSLLVKIYTQLINLMLTNNNTSLALKYSELAYTALCRKKKEGSSEYEEIVETLSLVGEVYFLTQNYSQAINILENLTHYLESFNTKPSDKLLKPYLYLANCYSHVNEVQKAITSNIQCIEIMNKLDPKKNKIEIVNCSCQLANLMLESGNFNDALELSRNSKKNLSIYNIEEASLILTALIIEGKAYAAMKNMNAAGQTVNEAFSLLEKLQLDTELKKEFQDLISEIGIELKT